MSVAIVIWFLCFSHIVAINVLVCLLLYRILIISRLGVTSSFPSFSLFFCNQFIIFYSGCVFFPTFCLCPFMWDDDAGIFLKKHSNSAVVAGSTYYYLLFLCVYSS